jgi:hypothetical protein
MFLPSSTLLPSATTLPGLAAAVAIGAVYPTAPSGFIRT